MSNSTEQPENSLDWKEKVTKHFQTMADLKIWTGAMGGDSIQDGLDRQNSALWAEDIAARKALGIEEAPDLDDDGGDDVGRRTHIGDYHETPPANVFYPPQEPRKPVLGTIAAIALGMAIPGAGLLGAGLVKYLGDNVETVVIEKGRDTATTLGLKRIGDLDRGE
jgi:hypothetical protein|tara:strand:- start:1232 stop:1726 length:495 start_codon:yes stop_codon:yes gene_type:complete